MSSKGWYRRTLHKNAIPVNLRGIIILTVQAAQDQVGPVSHAGPGRVLPPAQHGRPWDPPVLINRELKTLSRIVGSAADEWGALWCLEAHTTVVLGGEVRWPEAVVDGHSAKVEQLSGGGGFAAGQGGLVEPSASQDQT